MFVLSVPVGWIGGHRGLMPAWLFHPSSKPTSWFPPEHRPCISTLTNFAADYGAQGPLRENGFDLFTKTKKDLDNSTVYAAPRTKESLRITAYNIVACHIS